MGNSSQTIYISVIVPVYKVEPYLAKCLDSALEQDFDAYEIIVIDDGSPDGCGEIADAYAAKNPGLIRVIHQENQGLGGARNTGLEHAQGKYILFLDSDDWLEPDTLFVLFSQLERNDFPDMLIFGYFHDYEEDGCCEVAPAQAFEQDVCYSLESRPDLLSGQMMAWQRIVRKGVYMENRIRFPASAWFEDLFTTPKLLLQADSVYYLNQPFYHYRQRRNSIMQSKNIEKLEDYLFAIEDVLAYYREQEVYEKYYDELCFLAVKHVLGMGTLRMMNLKFRHPLLKKVRRFFINTFPDYRESPYLADWGKRELRRMEGVVYGNLFFTVCNYRFRQVMGRIIRKIAPGLAPVLRDLGG